MFYSFTLISVNESNMAQSLILLTVVNSPASEDSLDTDTQLDI